MGEARERATANEQQKEAGIKLCCGQNKIDLRGAFGLEV